MKTNQLALEMKETFRDFVLERDFPCLGAKAAFNSDSHTVCVFDELGSAETTDALAAGLRDFTAFVGRDATDTLVGRDAGSLVGRDAVEPRESNVAPRFGSTASRPTNGSTASRPTNGSTASRPTNGSTASRHSEFATFVAIFKRPRQTTEMEFERLFWRQLRLLHAHDPSRPAWAPNVTSDPADPRFSFSFDGLALYVIGMHANSSRTARRFAWPAMIFNPHEQFERLRADGKWKHMQETIRQRDLQLQGLINPMLSDFGERSEARQYSGRAVEEDWRAPFEVGERKCPFAH
jgi:FPC/CPF motif-containing protein YcgG